MSLNRLRIIRRAVRIAHEGEQYEGVKFLQCGDGHSRGPTHDTCHDHGLVTSLLPR